jgi:hypothetical protein
MFGRCLLYSQLQPERVAEAEAERVVEAERVAEAERAVLLGRGEIP